MRLIKGKDLNKEQRNQLPGYGAKDDRLFFGFSLTENRWKSDMTQKEWLDERCFEFSDDGNKYVGKYPENSLPAIYAEPAYHKLKRTGLFR